MGSNTAIIANFLYSYISASLFLSARYRSEVQNASCISSTWSKASHLLYLQQAQLQNVPLLATFDKVSPISLQDRIEDVNNHATPVSIHSGYWSALNSSVWPCTTIPNISHPSWQFCCGAHVRVCEFLPYGSSESMGSPSRYLHVRFLPLRQLLLTLGSSNDPTVSMHQSTYHDIC
jgi:hypothetical protein